MQKGDNPVADPEVFERLDAGRVAILALWLTFVVYVFGFAPGVPLGGGGDAGDLDVALLKALIKNPFDPAVNPFFVFFFNSLGIIPAIYGALLLPGSSGQKPLPTLPFVLGSFFAGFLALGPYLGLRADRTTMEFVAGAKDFSTPQRIADSRLTGLALLASAIGLVYFALTNNGIVTGSALENFSSLFNTLKLVHVSTLDSVLLSILMYGPLLEDLKRRDRTSSIFSSLSPEVRAGLFCAVPLIGPCLHLVTRPSLVVENGGK